jgi:adrenodoxin-NADP+ reductase
MSSLLANYTHLVLGAGCTMPILHPVIPPSDHCIPALNLVHWYTKHPSRPSPPPLDKVRHVSIIGQGNVSLDIARMLLSRVSDLAKYDVPDSVLDVLSRSQVRHISIIGRRGPFQAAFTAKELREMMDLPGAAMYPIDPDLLEAPGVDLTRQRSRIISLLKRGSRTSASGPSDDVKTWSLEFFRSPTGISLSSSSASLFELSLAHTVLDKNGRAIPSGGTSTVPTDLVVTSLGYRSDPTLNWYDPSLGYVRNVSGRVINEAGNTLQNVYTSGWAARGAKGVLASTMIDAYALAETILSDATVNAQDLSATGSIPAPVPPSVQDLPEQVMKRIMRGDSSDLDGVPKEVEDGLRDGLVMTHEDWKLIDQEEIRRGLEARDGKERERMEWEQARDFVASKKR